MAHCPACAAWAKRAAGLDRLWEATRPPEPSSEVWDALWGRLARSLDASMPHEVDVIHTVCAIPERIVGQGMRRKSARLFRQRTLPDSALGSDRADRPGPGRRGAPRRGLILAGLRPVPATSGRPCRRSDVFSLGLAIGGRHLAVARRQRVTTDLRLLTSPLLRRLFPWWSRREVWS